MSKAIMTAASMLKVKPEWDDAYQRMSAAFRNGGAEASSDPGPIETGLADQGVLEAFARSMAENASPKIAMSLTLPMALAAASVACQGAYWLKVPQPGGQELEIPAIFQCTLIAPSGYGKSNAMDPLIGMVDELNREGINRRKKMVTSWYTQAIEQMGLTGGATPGSAKAGAIASGELDNNAEIAKVRSIYNAGLCKRLTLDSGTPEGVRRALLRGGGVAGIMTAEPDVLREIGGYSKDSGTFRWLLDGWGGSKVGVARGDREMVVPRTVLPYCIVVQPSAFDQFNTSRVEKDGGNDSAIGRGLYGRSWLVRVANNGGSGIAFGMEDDAPYDDDPTVVGPLLAARLDVENKLFEIMHRSDEYRARMGVAIGWEEAAAQDKEGEMPCPKLPDKVYLTLAKDAQADYIMIQNMRIAFIDQVSAMELENPGVEKILTPMVTRLTQHILRVAMLLQLTKDPSSEVVERWAVRDAGLRLVPWLMEHWAAEMGRYAIEIQAVMVEQEFRNNVKGEDITLRGRLIAAVGKVVTAKGGGEGATFTQGEVVSKARDSFRSSVRSQLTPGLNEEFDRMAEEGWVAHIGDPGLGGKMKSAPKYRRTPVGILHGL